MARRKESKEGKESKKKVRKGADRFSTRDSANKNSSLAKFRSFVVEFAHSARTAWPEVNKRVLGLVMLLCFIGIVTVYSAGYYQTVASGDTTFYLRRQAMYMATGLILMVAAASFDYHKYNKWALTIIAISILMLVAVMVVGSSANGAQRWIGFGPIRITPSEFSKLAVIIYTSVFLAAEPKRVKGKYLFWIFFIMIIHAALIVKQPNLSTAIVLCAIMFAILLVAGINMIWIGGGLAALTAGVVAILTIPQFRGLHWYARLTSWRDPFADAQGSGYQVSQSLIALGNGGLKGLGIARGITKNGYLPEPQNDFILAVFGEETGYIGFLFLMLIYILLFYQCIMVAARAKDRLGFYLATGVSVMLALQVIVNVAVVTASMPATGITLPFISYGGTSIWVFMYSMGMLLNVSRNQIDNPRMGKVKK